MTDWIYLLLLAFGFCSTFGIEETVTGTETNRYDSSNLMERKKNNESLIKNRGSKKRRFLDAMVDGKIIGSLGELFGDEVKREADKERKEREKIRADRLIAKYTSIMNDPEAFAKLQRESANAPTLINQQVRRSFSPESHEWNEAGVTKNQFNEKTVDSVESGSNKGTNDPQSRNMLVQIVLPQPIGLDCRSQMLQVPDYPGFRNPETMTRSQSPVIYLNMARNYGRQNYFGRSTFPSQSAMPISHKIADLIVDVAGEIADEINYRRFGK